VDQLRALAYVDVVEGAEDLLSGLLTSDPARVQAGLTDYSNAPGCSSELIATNGKTLYLRRELSTVDEASRLESARSPLTHTGLDQPRWPSAWRARR
jgi:hypothetical protein